MTTQLKGGYTTEDPRLDRVPSYDERSRNYPIRPMVEDKKPRSYTWRLPIPVLDQGREGACVGFSWAHELAARPSVQPADAALALRLYRRAQHLDEWPGEQYSGTSTLAGAKAVMEIGGLKEYRWGFSLTDAILAIGYKGPGIAGIPWFESDYQPKDGLLTGEGALVGYHAILVNGVSVPKRRVGLPNTWGPDWGKGGYAEMTWEEFERRLHHNGEFCIPVKRSKVRT